MILDLDNFARFSILRNLTLHSNPMQTSHLVVIGFQRYDLLLGVELLLDLVVSDLARGDALGDCTLVTLGVRGWARLATTLDLGGGEEPNSTLTLGLTSITSSSDSIVMTSDGKQ